MSEYKLQYGIYQVLRRDKNLNQQAIADAIGTNRQRINYIVNAHETCPADLAQRWAALMGVPLEELFEEVKEPVEVSGE